MHRKPFKGFKESMKFSFKKDHFGSYVENGIDEEARGRELRKLSLLSNR